MLKRGLLLILLVGFPSLLRAAEDCAVGMGTVCIEPVAHDNIVTLSAHNRETYEVTVTVTANLKNMTSSVKLPYTQTLPGGFQEPLLTLLLKPKASWKGDYSFHWTPGAIDARHDDSVVYDLPYRGTHLVIQGFHGAFSHTGDQEYAVDWEMPMGTPVYAAREGVVEGTRATMTNGGPDPKLANFDNFVLIRHADGTIGTYDHFRQGGVVVKVGDEVTRKQLIGYSGNTGFTSGPHLHFMIFKANDGYTRTSFPMRFQTARGIISPAEGKSYSSLP